MSDLFEMSVYNDAVRYYKRKKFEAHIRGMQSDGAFRYKLSTSGLVENFSYFEMRKEAIRTRGPQKSLVLTAFDIHHNIKLQSAHDRHVYFTADISDGSCITQSVAGGRRYSYIPNESIATFFEAKNLNPFPELMFGFSGLVLEILPEFMSRYWLSGNKHLLPCLVMSGKNAKYAERVAESLTGRYAFNIVSGLYANKGQIYSFKKLREYDRRN